MVDKGCEFYNRSMKSFLQNNNIEIYSTHNEGRSVIAKRFIRTLKNKSYRHMTSISKNVYTDKLDGIGNKCINTYYKTIKITPVDVKSSTYIDSSKEINHKDLKFKIGDIVRISKYKNIFAKGYVPNWSEEVFVIKKVKNTVPWKYVIKEIVGMFYEKELQKTNQKEFTVEKVIKRKGDMLNGNAMIVLLIVGLIKKT